MEQEFSFAYLVKIIAKRFKILVIACAAALLLAFVFSGPSFIKPKFTSSAIVYPSNLTPYSSETRTEQLLQLCEASDIRDSLIEKFDLAASYEINPSEKGGRHMLIEEYNSRVVIQKTRYESVEITIDDESPDTAYAMVKELMHQVNLKARNLQREKSIEIVEMRKRQVDEQQQYVDSLENILADLRANKGLIHFEIQTTEATKGYYRMASSPGRNASAYSQAEQLISNLKEDGMYFKYIFEQATEANRRYSKLVEAYQEADNDIKKELTYVNAVVSPEVPDKKSYPVRWLIVFTAVFSTALFCVVAFLFAENQIFAKAND